MALGYTDLFTDLGKLAKYYNSYATAGQAIAADVDAIFAVFAGTHMEAALDGLRPGAQSDWEDSYADRRSSLAEYARRRVTEKVTVLDELGAIDDDIDTVFPKLIEQMLIDAQSIDDGSASTASLGSAIPGIAGATVTGTVLITTTLDAVSSPGSRFGVNFPAHHKYKGLASELLATETIMVRCVADSFADGLTEGGETFAWEGDFEDSQHGVLAAEGSGDLGSVTAIHGGTSAFLANADFETWTVTNTPDSWTIDAGTVTTNILQSTSEFYHALSSLRLLGSGAAAITLSQAMGATVVKAGKRYCVCFRLKADATIAAGTLTVKFVGTGYTEGATEKIEIAPGALPTSWTLESFFVNIPENIPSDFKLQVSWSGTPTTAKNIYLDDFGVGEVNWGAGLGIVVVRSSTPFVRNDRWPITVTNNCGVFAKWIRRLFGYQLPSNNSPTQADSLAT